MTKPLSIEPTGAVFRAGDEVVLAQGTYQGTPGVFMGLKEDAKWANIQERDGSVRSHPMLWLSHASIAAPGRVS